MTFEINLDKVFFLFQLFTVLYCVVLYFVVLPPCGEIKITKNSLCHDESETRCEVLTMETYVTKLEHEVLSSIYPRTAHWTSC